MKLTRSVDGLTVNIVDCTLDEINSIARKDDRAFYLFCARKIAELCVKHKY